MATSTKFEQSTAVAKLVQGEIHIWHARSEQFSGGALDEERLLSADERVRADRFRFKKDRDRYATSRGILRKLLGEYCDISPSTLEFRYGSHGKPYLTEKCLPYSIQFNVSHSHELVLFAFSRDGEIGIDVERVRKDLEFENIARRFLTPDALAKLAALGEEEKSEEFFRFWTRMEACAKAQGLGISLLDDPASRIRESACDSRGELSDGWVTDFTPESGYVGSVASLSSISSLKHWKYPLAPQP
jgi:4'-phosphopantetheinyl transferase